MSLYINACNIFIASLHQLPDPTLQQIYQQTLNCSITRVHATTSANLPSIAASQINNFFPNEIYWWPLYTTDEINSKSFQRVISSGIKPGIILSNEHLSFKQYQKAKYAVLKGAIPILEYDPQHADSFSAQAMFYTALGLRPLAAYIPTGWNPNVLNHPKGTYIFQNTEKNEFPLPTREIFFQDHTLYAAQASSYNLTGTQIVINPPDDIPLDNIIYPKFDISWQFHGVAFTSTPHGIDTSLLGYIIIPLSLLSIPIDVIVNSRYPDILTSLGTSISWISLLLGLVLIVVLIISTIKRARKDEPH